MSFCQRISVSAFNKFCLVFIAFWLAITIPLGVKYAPTWPDFSQFYMAAQLVRAGEWKALYPIPRVGSQDNPGMSGDSLEKMQWRAIRRELGVPNDTRFILPPPSALLFLPLSFMSLMPAYWTWLGILGACIWGVAFVAGRIHRIIAGAPSRMEGVLAILVTLSPMTARSIRIGNVTPPVALTVGIALLALIEDKTSRSHWQGALAVTLGVLLKYATLVLTPLLIAMRKWRMLFWIGAFGVLSLVVTFIIAGAHPFIEFIHDIMPTLSRPSPYLGNQSLPGMLARLVGKPLPEHISLALTVARLGTLVIILITLFRVPQSEWNKPSVVAAGAALMMSWLLIFSPIAWEHWPVFLCPMWGWMIWECRFRGAPRWLAISSLVLMYFPAGILQVQGFLTRSIFIPEPLNSWQLIGVGLVLYLALLRLDHSRAASSPSL